MWWDRDGFCRAPHPSIKGLKGNAGLLKTSQKLTFAVVISPGFVGAPPHSGDVRDPAERAPGSKKEVFGGPVSRRFKTGLQPGSHRALSRAGEHHRAQAPARPRCCVAH